ncbi:acyl-[acyl-carrier-protein] hydrolase FATB3, chloroplastic-like [Bidens hawaiensis]|uniref:acyl-[acyl-carrier-protein] hydrolase FATB3, chloroplastic-like n=1 Tax=Bidens hawaiensis TaxID=980011 RepID=UPI00404A70CD
MATLCPSNVPGFKACLLKGGGNYSDDFLKVCGFKINRASTTTKTGWTTMSAAPVAGVSTKAVEERMRDPTRKQFRVPLPPEFAILDGLGYRQTIVVRSYEVKSDKTMTLESILNHLQMLRLGDGFGETPGMMKNNLVWDITRMQVQVDEYPLW